MEKLDLINFMEIVGRLKHLKRMGWVYKNIKDPETISGHMYRMAILSMLVDNTENLDKSKIIQMSLVHDLAESIVGDITPRCGVSPEDKHRREDEAMTEICDLLGDKGPDMLKLFREYESQESEEAKYVKDLDRLDLIMQAYEYEKRDGNPGHLEEFYVNSTHKIRHPKLIEMANEIVKRRNDLFLNAQSNNKH